MNKKKIGCLTWHDVYNFGSELQAYALQQTLAELGYNSEFISYKKERTLFSRIYFGFCELRAMISPRSSGGHAENFIRFRREFLNCSKKKYTAKNIATSNDDYSVFICGSDQIWAPNVYDSVYFLSFTDKKKISYAASIGLNEIPIELSSCYKRHLSDFHSVSVREKDGKELLKNSCGVDSVVMPDPTALLTKQQWEQIAVLPKTSNSYVFCYFLNKDHSYKETVQKMVDEGTEIIGVSASSEDFRWMHIIKDAGPREFLGYIRNAQAVFTDSFHGSILSLIFHKPLWIFERFKSDDPLCQNSRIYQLTGDLEITDRILNETRSSQEKIDYDAVQLKLDEYITKGKVFLRNSLGE